MVIRIVLALLFTTALNLEAQEIQANKSSLKISDFSAQLGITSLSLPASSIDDFRRLAPQSVLLNANYENYNSSQLASYNSNSFMSILLGFELINRKNNEFRTNPKLRLGFNYGSFSTLSGYLNQSERFVYDTLVSTQSGNVYYADSIVNRTLHMDQNTEQLSIDVALLFRTNTENRISLYTGFGLGAGISMNTNTNIRYNKRSNSVLDIEADAYLVNEYFSEQMDLQTESFISKNPYTLWVYIPIGIDFRIGKYSELLKHTHLYLETRPAITRTSIPDFGSSIGASIAFAGGMRYSF
jgi:hypothetical protein